MQINTEIASVVKPDSPGAAITFAMRSKIYNKLASEINLESVGNILDIGVTPDADAAYSNFFECVYPYKDRITALSDQNAEFLEKLFPGLKFVQGDGRKLPFADNTFELVISSAVIEHVGAYENQKKFIEEALRVSSRYVFINTPNRWHIFEFHTYFPFLHWLPKKWHRAILNIFKLHYLAKEENLNLLDKNTLKKICRELGINCNISFVRFIGMPSNLLLFIEKKN